jgi:hypothetical protein
MRAGKREKGNPAELPSSSSAPRAAHFSGVHGGGIAQGQAADRVIPAEPSGVSGIFEAMLKTLLKESGARSFG